jgi:hypothetical protein
LGEEILVRQFCKRVVLLPLAGLGVAASLAACNYSLAAGLGTLVATALLVLVLALASLVGSSGCGSTRSAVGADSGTDAKTALCLSPDIRLGPCLGRPYPDVSVTPCLGPRPPDAQVGPCLEAPFPDLGVCLAQRPPDAYLGPCLDTSFDDAGVSPCLYVPSDAGASLSPPPDPGLGTHMALAIEQERRAVVAKLAERRIIALDLVSRVLGRVAREAEKRDG